MLTGAIAAAYAAGSARLASLAEPVVPPEAAEPRMARPAVLRLTAETFLSDPALHEEVFGPLGLIVTVRDADETLALARALEGQLTATLQIDASDHEPARRLLEVLERKAGRLLVNGWPTGVEVADAMVHGGPYPASTNFGATSVGSMAIRRFLRPVCYQNVPTDLLPQDLRG
jgi:2,5-dioxopentanoate dehydrogenase